MFYVVFNFDLRAFRETVRASFKIKFGHHFAQELNEQVNSRRIVRSGFGSRVDNRLLKPKF